MKAAGITRRQSPRTVECLAVSAALAASVIVLSWVDVARGENLSDIPAAFVEVGVGAGPMGMGGAVVASVEGANAIFWNPAGLALGEGGRQYAVSYCDQMGLIPYSAGVGTQPVGPYTIGLGLLYSGDDALSETTLLVGAATELRVLPWAPDHAAAVGASVRARRASFGNNESGGEQVTGSALGVGLDVGVVVPLTDATALGVTARDLFNVLSWDSSAAGSYGENVPTTLAAGLGIRPRDGLLLEVDLDKSLHLDTDDVVRAGAELELFGVARVRGGYCTALRERASDEYSLGAGASFPAGTAMMTLDVAYLFGDLSNTLRLSLEAAL
jgi:hypothetical protein